jgi:hypothetical protein
LRGAPSLHARYGFWSRLQSDTISLTRLARFDRGFESALSRVGKQVFFGSVEFLIFIRKNSISTEPFFSVCDSFWQFSLFAIHNPFLQTPPQQRGACPWRHSDLWGLGGVGSFRTTDRACWHRFEREVGSSGDRVCVGKVRLYGNHYPKTRVFSGHTLFTGREFTH